MAKRVIPLFFCYILHIKSEYIISYHHITWGSITYSGLVLSNLSNEEGKGRIRAMRWDEMNWKVFLTFQLRLFMLLT